MMEIYVKDKKTFETLGKVDVSINNDGKKEFEFVLNEEQNGVSTLTVINQPYIKENNFIIIYDFIKPLFFKIEHVSLIENSQKATLKLRPIMYLFNRKVIEEDRGNLSLEQYIKRLIENNFINSNDKFNKINFLTIEALTNTNEQVDTQSENFLFNLSTYITNCNQKKNIKNLFSIEGNRLFLKLQRIPNNKRLKIDLNNSEIKNLEVDIQPKLITKVEVFIRNTSQIYNLYLRNDRTTTENINDPNRLDGETEVISVDILEKAREDALNVFKGNRYDHAMNFSILKTSELIDVSKLEVGDLVEVYYDGILYESYISSITYRDSILVDIKLGNLKTKFTEFIKNTVSLGNKLDSTGGNITGNLTVGGKRILTVSDLKDGVFKVTKTGIQNFNQERFDITFDNTSISKGNIAVLENGNIKILRGGTFQLSYSTFLDYLDNGYVFTRIKIQRGSSTENAGGGIITTARLFYSNSETFTVELQTNDILKLDCEVADFSGNRNFNGKVRGEKFCQISLIEI